MMLGYPLRRPSVELDVMHKAVAIAADARAEVAAARPLVSEEVIVIADVLVEALAKARQ